MMYMEEEKEQGKVVVHRRGVGDKGKVVKMLIHCKYDLAQLGAAAICI